MTWSVESRIRILRTRAEIEDLREFWCSCRPERDADLDFYLFIVDRYPEAERPHVIVLYEGGDPKALLAGRLDVTNLPIRVGYFALPAPKLRILQFVHGGWLGDISEAGAKLLIGSVVETLASGEADAAMLHYPNLSSPLVRGATHLPGRLCSDRLIRPQAHWIRDFLREDATFLGSLSRNARYQQRKRARRLREDFNECEILSFAAPKDVERLMCDAEIVAQKSYQRGLGVGFLATLITRARLEFEAGAGWLRGYVLYFDKHPCAFWIASLRNGIFLSDYLAFDPDYGQYVPGTYLILKVMEELYETDPGAVKRVDFGIGDAIYKERLSNDHWDESLVYIFAPNLKGMGVNALRSAVGLLDSSVRPFMRMTPMLGTLKRTWRTHAARRN